MSTSQLRNKSKIFEKLHMPYSCIMFGAIELAFKKYKNGDNCGSQCEKKKKNKIK